MESAGAFPEGDWESLSKMFSAEDLEFTPHFLGQCSLINNPNSYSHNTNFVGTMFPNSEPNHHHQSLFHTLESLNNSNLQYLSQDSSYSTGTNYSGSQEESYNYLSESYNHINNNNSDDFSVPNFLVDQCNNFPVFADNNDVKENPDHNYIQLKRNACDSGAEEKSNAGELSDQNPKKKPRVQRSSARKNNAKSQAKPAQNGKLEEENSNTSSYSSEDDNASQENNGGETLDAKASSTIVNLNGKARASRGSATDPQSLYARKRRERINERLRILQNLVPNGTKVDISTMLEEAVQYVKFLQLQIKLLSSDDMWMYAPLAYNGMDIGLNKKLSQLV